MSLNLPDADFYIQRNGSEATVGQPLKVASADHFGVKVDRSVLLPEFFYYFVQYCHQAGYFRPHACGTLRLKHLRRQDVLSVLREQAERHWKPAQVAQNLADDTSWLVYVCRHREVQNGITLESVKFHEKAKKTTENASVTCSE